MDPIDDLFALPPDRFIPARDELVRRLAEDGDQDAAAAVKGLRKPTLVAWALNQLPRRFGSDLNALIEAGEALRAAQRKAAAGTRGRGFLEATERRRSAIRDLTEKAVVILSEVGKPGQPAEAELGRTLEAASVDSQAGQQLLEGRLSRAITTVPGFDSVGGFEVISGEGNRSEPAREAETSAARAAVRNAERQAGKADADARRARMRADTLAQEAAELRRRAEHATEEAEKLERAAALARQKLERARRQAGER